MGHVGKTVTQNVVSGSEITDGTVTGDDLASDIAINTSGTITATANPAIIVNNNSLARVQLGNSTVGTGDSDGVQLQISGANGFVGSYDGTMNIFGGSSGTTATGITVDANGRVTKPLQPRLNAIRGSSRLVAVDGSETETLVPFVEQTDIGNNFASNTFTCPIDGSYFVSFFGMVLNPDSYAFVTIKLNSTTVMFAYEDDNDGKAGANNIACNAIIVASANDTIKAFFGGGNVSSKLHEGNYGGINIQLIA